MLMDRTIALSAPDMREHNFLFERMTGWEGLGRPFWYDVDVLSRSNRIDKFSLLGKPMTVALMTEAVAGIVGVPRFFRGLITKFTQVAWTGEMFRYRAHLRPALWLLTRTTNSRIFQPSTMKLDKMTVVEIVEAVLKEHGVDVDITLLGQAKEAYKYYEHDFLVQYQESDFNFISRLLEREGIYYFFKHEEDKEIMVLADDVTALPTQREGERVPFFPPNDQSANRRERDHVDGWTSETQVEPELYKVKDYDFEKPTAPMQVLDETSEQQVRPKRNGHHELSIYEYPGRYRFPQDDKRRPYAKRRLQEQRVDAEHYAGTANVRTLIPGSIFTLVGYPGESEVDVQASAQKPRKFLITAASFTLISSEFTSGTGQNEEDYRVSFRAVHADTQYRPPLVTPRPTVQGPQTAMVVGEDGAEISTDKYGRVKVKFRWDLDEEKNEKSSCWVSVSQLWAGSGWGAMHVPRIGQEVIVDFLEGDPDQPVITGRLYNADRMPPADADHKTQSYIRSHSTPGGGPSNFNEIRFEDKMGGEKFFMQAEKDQIIKVKANRTANVGANDTLSVGGNRSVTVTGNLSVTVDGSKGGPGPHSKYTVTGKHSLSATQTIDITATECITLTCGLQGTMIKMEPTKITFKAGAGAEIVLDANVLATANGKGSILIDPDVLIKGAKGGEVKVDDNVCAKSSAGKQVLADQGKVQLSAGGTVTVDAAKVDISGKEVVAKGGTGKVELNTGGAAITGMMVKLNS